MGPDILSIIGGLITIVLMVLGYVMKRKNEKEKDTDALARAESDELGAGMDRVDKLYPPGQG